MQSLYLTNAQNDSKNYTIILVLIVKIWWFKFMNILFLSMSFISEWFPKTQWSKWNEIEAMSYLMKAKPYGYICHQTNLSDISSVWIKSNHSLQMYSFSRQFPSTAILLNLLYSISDHLSLCSKLTFGPSKTLKTC